VEKVIEGQEIVYVGNDWFTENKTSSHHIAEILSLKNKILYIEGAGQRAPLFTQRDLIKVGHKVYKAFKRNVCVNTSLHIYSPIVLPIHNSKIARRINGLILRFSIRRMCKRLGFTSPILWILVPHYYHLAGALNEKGLVYYCVDEYSAQPHVDSLAIKYMENILLKKAGVVFTVSEELYKKKKIINPNTYLSLHGVDVEHFKKAAVKSLKLPDDIARIPGPIVGFFGLIQKRVDLELIKYLAHMRPDISFVLLGLVAQDTSIFQKAKNVHFLGAKPYKSLPEYLNAFDVTIMPYVLNDEMINSNPKKTREYLASGKPVVSVRIKEVERFRDLVHVADTYEEFLNAIDLAIRNDSPEKSHNRIRAMEKESWEFRVEGISKIVEKHLKIKKTITIKD
jgi:glycosyltransferase involved in cell wall biosynthesis